MEKFNVYQGRKVNKIDISELDFLLGDVGLEETKTFEKTSRVLAMDGRSPQTQASNLPQPIGSTMSLAAQILAKIAAKKNKENK
jgi:hypothetical protein